MMTNRLDQRSCFLLMVTVSLPLLLLSCLGEEGNDDENETAEYIVENDRLPQFNVEIDDGTTVCTTDLLGRKSVIVFFSTSCDDCRRWLHVLNLFYVNNALPNNVNVLCIAREEKKELVERFWKEQKFSVPYAAPQSRNIYNLFATSGVPRVYIVNEAGIVTKMFKDANLPTAEDLSNSILNSKK